jgi:GxxExxY protein
MLWGSRWDYAGSRTRSKKEFHYKGVPIKGQRLDFVVAGEVVVEIKSSELPDVAYAQVLSYLKATGLRRALLLNFGMKRMIDGVKRVSN